MNCPVCDCVGMNSEFRVRPPVHLRIDGPVYAIWGCRDCGYKVAKPSPDRAVLERVYGADFYDTLQQDVPIGDDGRFLGGSSRWPVYKNAVRRVEMLRRMRPVGRLLDVGCGKGIFVKIASRYYDAIGIDVSPHAARWGRKLGIEVRCGDFLDENFSGLQCDIVTFWDSLASMSEPVEVTRKASLLLTDGGVIVATLPDGGSVACRLLGRYWPLMIPPINVAFHTRRSVELIAERCGLRLRRFVHQGKWVDAGFLLLKLRRTLRVDRRGARSPRSVRPFNVFLNLRDIATVILEKV